MSKNVPLACCQADCPSLAELTMKRLPDEKELAELVELARTAAEKARGMSELATAIAQKHQKCMDEIKQSQRK
jgi:hypothetical protein